MILEDHHEEYRGQVRAFMDEVVAPSTADLDMTRPLTRDEVAGLRKIYAQHEIGVTEPQHEDGSPDLIAIAIFTEELNRVDASLGAMPQALFFPSMPMLELLDAPQREAFGHLFEAGSMVAVGLSEPGVGSYAGGVQTSAHLDGDEWVINGHKLWTSNAVIADAILVTCRVPVEDGAFSMFVVDRDTYGFEPRTVPLLGMTAVSTCEVRFENCRVPALARLGGSGGGLRGNFAILNRARINISFTAIGIAQAALEDAVQYARTREQFGRPIASFQLVQEMIADMATKVTAARALAFHATQLVAAGRPARKELSMGKAVCTEMAVEVASLGIQVHGALGLTKECRAERYFRDARMQTIPDGTTQIHKLVIGRELLGVSALV